MHLLRHLTLLCAALTTAAPLLAAEVVVYSARNEQLIKPVFDAYTQATGVKVNFITDKEAPLLTRLQQEGASSPADLLLTVDAGNLWQAAEQGLLQPVQSKALDTAVPAHLRDPQNRWFGLSVRARTLFFNPSLTSADQLSSYEALAEPKWQGKLCLRSSKKVYNQSLVAMMIATHGEEKTESLVKGWVANLAAPPFADDTKLLEAIAAGQCAVGIANTYYYGRLLAKKPELPVKLFWANQGSDGTHVNIAGAGLTRHAPHRDEAVKLLEWLASPAAQNLFVDANFEYPVNPQVAPATKVQGWGEYKANLLNVATAGQLQAAAVKLMDRAGYK
ncbi:MAG: Fe(3+) ABC transporter substrate-binding protein [Gammaproteobacteria bacterium]|nr:Fe(3+) ABC transporter substrate-binding protein [Gammaproteobacteria bacterium]